MGGCSYGGYPIYLGMGIAIFGSNQCPTRHAIKLDHSTSIDLGYWSVLGALVGSQTQTAIN